MYCTCVTHRGSTVPVVEADVLALECKASCLVEWSHRGLVATFPRLTGSWPTERLSQPSFLPGYFIITHFFTQLTHPLVHSFTLIPSLSFQDSYQVTYGPQHALPTSSSTSIINSSTQSEGYVHCCPPSSPPSPKQEPS
jgi:hypothetical protein